MKGQNGIKEDHDNAEDKMKPRLLLKELTEQFAKQEELIREGGSKKGHDRQRRLGRITARERLAVLFDEGQQPIELGLWSAYGMYEEWGGLPAAGLICAIGAIEGRYCMVIANDATVKAGAMFPLSIKKLLKAQRVAFNCRLPLLYLVDSAGVFLPLQEEIFPDEHDFGRIFRNNAVIAAHHLPQFAAIMGNCVAGGGYLPVLCDKLLMTKGSGLYIAGPALVKAAIGQSVETEELGGAHMHASISGTVDFVEEDDVSCLYHLRKLVGMLPDREIKQITYKPAALSPEEVYDIVAGDNSLCYDSHKLLNTLIDEDSGLEYMAEYGQAIICVYARIEGQRVGLIANQRKAMTDGKGERTLGGVIYAQSAEKAARFVHDCNQIKMPLLFIQDVVGFMVGKAAEESGIIKAGARLIREISTCSVAKMTLIVGNSFGAGHYALCGAAYDPLVVIAWPNAKYAVMGGEQASDTLIALEEVAAQRRGVALDEELRRNIKEKVVQDYAKQMDIRYGASRGWVDLIIAPHRTRELLGRLLLLIETSEQEPQPPTTL